MKTNLHLDWLSVTEIATLHCEIVQAGDTAYWLTIGCADVTGIAGDWKIGKPRFGYKYAYAHPSGLLLFVGTNGMGVHCIYSAQCLQALQFGWGKVAESVVRDWAAKGKATRVDVALDIIGGVTGVGVYRTALKTGKAFTASRTWRGMEGSEGGNTLYIGSRSSERMVRVYDKKAERAAKFEAISDSSWIRIELELKGKQAENFLDAAEHNTLSSVLRGYLQAAVDFPTVDEWRIAMNTDAGAITPQATRRKDTATRHWLLNKIAPVLARETLDDLSFQRYFESEVKRQQEELKKRRGSGTTSTD